MGQFFRDVSNVPGKKLNYARYVGTNSQYAVCQHIALRTSRVWIPALGPFPILPPPLSPTSLPVTSTLSCTKVKKFKIMPNIYAKHISSF